MLIRRLTPDDAASYQRLRLSGLREAPSAFGSSAEEEAAYTLEFVAARLAPDAPATVFGAFQDDALVGLCGLLRHTRPRFTHKAEVWGVYVAPSARRTGLARKLMQHTMDHARTLEGLHQLHLGVNATNAAGQALYESLGFEPYGCEPSFMVIDGAPHDEVMMVLRLG